jgi:hypothetical protein
MLSREIIAVCSEIHTKYTNTLCGQNVGFVNVKPGCTYSNHWALKVEGWEVGCWRMRQRKDTQHLGWILSLQGSILTKCWKRWEGCNRRVQWSQGESQKTPIQLAGWTSFWWCIIIRFLPHRTHSVSPLQRLYSSCCVAIVSLPG